jgi:hypothetical protein
VYAVHSRSKSTMIEDEVSPILNGSGMTKAAFAGD